LDAVELAELNAAMQSPAKMQTIGQLLDYAENTDCFVLINAKDNRSLGEYYLNDSGLFVVPDPWKPAIDTDRLGSFIASEEQGTFTDYGYILRTSDEWQRVHEGQPVPEPYRVMAYPAPELLREESKVQPEAAAPAKAPQPVTPILLNGQNSAERMKEITDRLETGIQELFESERYKAYLTTMSKFHSYSFNNTLLIAMQGGQLVAGYNKWRDDFHRNVKKGEKAIKILAPAPFKAKKEVQKLDAQGRPVMGKDGKPVTEVQEIQVPAFKIVSVFDVSQTEGEPLPSIGVEELTGSVERYGEFFKALEQTSPVPIGFEDIPGGSHGYYHLTEKRIAIQEGMSELQTLKTAIHEIAHSKLHAIDPEAPAIEQADRPDSRTREVQAESVAYAVCQHYGLDTSDYSFGYVAGWSSGKDLKELKASLETIRATAHELITTIDGHLAQLQQQRQTQQEQPQAAEQPDPDSVFSKLSPKQQQEMTASVKAMLQTLIEVDLKSTGEVSQGTKEAAQAQGFSIARDGTLEQVKAPQEAAYRLESGDYLHIQTSESGYNYTLYAPDYKELDGGQLDNPDLTLAEAGKEILSIHELPAGTMEPLTGDRLDDFLEATEQANAIPQPQSWNGIDGLLNGKLFMPEASPADRAVTLMELAEKNAPRLGSEERQLIVAYAEAVGDNDKVIGLINRLCEQGYELQEGQIDSFVKSEIESEIAVANAQRQIAQNPAAEPVVTILWSESPHLKDGQQMPLHEAEAVFKELDSARRHDREQPGYTGHWYDKTKFRIDFTMQGQPDSYEGRQDFGDGDGSLIQHIRGCHEYYTQDESWKNHVLHHEGPEAWEADKAQRDMLLHEFVPYMELHCNLAAMEQEARRPLRSGETLTPEQTAYFNAVLDYVKECRPLLNQGQYHLPEPPQLADFDQSLQDYKKQIEAELEQEAAASGLTVEEYVASDYEAPAQPNFSIYQVPPGPEGRDLRYRSYEDLQADGLSVDRKNYQLVYTAPLDKDTTLDEIYRRFNIEHPADYKGHSLSTGDIVVFRQDGKQTAYYVDEGADYRQVPEFFAQPEKQLTPDECMTGEQIQTPRGRFYLTDRSREQMEAAGYGFHHQSEDGRYLIMANGTRAFAIPAQPESHIKTAEMSTEQNYNMIDGMMNNAPSMEELEARAKAGEQISLLDVAEAAKAEAKKPKQTRKTTQKQKKPSIRAQLAAAKEEQKKRPPAREKSKEMEV
ncbi:MAG: LPD25 domain-containing protein, partial [Christensenellales bacterium]